MIAREQKKHAYFSAQRKHAGSAVKALCLMAESGVPNGTRGGSIKQHIWNIITYFISRVK